MFETNLSCVLFVLTFDDGIFWMTMGEKLSEGDVLTLVRNLVAQIKPGYTPFDTLEWAKRALQEAVGNRYMLLVMDDI